MKLMGVIKRWIGLSGDSKPTPDSVHPGSTFYETDTGHKYVDTGTAWVLDTR